MGLGWGTGAGTLVKVRELVTSQPKPAAWSLVLERGGGDPRAIELDQGREMDVFQTHKGGRGGHPLSKWCSQGSRAHGANMDILGADSEGW